MSTQRQPKGIPVGGQFTANSHDEASTLLPGEDARAEALALNDELDREWVEANLERASGGRIRKNRAAWMNREREIRKRLTLLSEEVDERGFQPYTFTTPKQDEYPVFHGDDDEYDSEHEWTYHRVGVRHRAFEKDPDAAIAEIEADIQAGVESGSLSPLFDYHVEHGSETESMRSVRSLTVRMTLKHGVPQSAYRDVSRARVSSFPVYSDRVRGTVTKIGERLTAYSASSLASTGDEDEQVRVRVTTDQNRLAYPRP